MKVNPLKCGAFTFSPNKQPNIHSQPIEKPDVHRLVSTDNLLLELQSYDSSPMRCMTINNNRNKLCLYYTALAQADSGQCDKSHRTSESWEQILSSIVPQLLAAASFLLVSEFFKAIRDDIWIITNNTCELVDSDIKMLKGLSANPAAPYLTRCVCVCALSPWLTCGKRKTCLLWCHKGWRYLTDISQRLVTTTPVGCRRRPHALPCLWLL